MTEGETIPELTRRVQSVFSRLSRERAEMIARTEAARAVHAASLLSAKESGVVSGKKWLLSRLMPVRGAMRRLRNFRTGLGWMNHFTMMEKGPIIQTVSTVRSIRIVDVLFATCLLLSMSSFWLSSGRLSRSVSIIPAGLWVLSRRNGR